jgi:hypothetical protein
MRAKQGALGKSSILFGFFSSALVSMISLPDGIEGKRRVSDAHH